MFGEIVLVAVLPALLAAAAIWDLTSYTIPNVLTGALALSFFVFAALTGMELAVLGWHVAAAAAGLTVGFALFAAGFVGGGDAKLFAAAALWIGIDQLPAYAVVAALAGGLLTIVLLSVRRLPLPAAFARHEWILRLHDRKAGVPYGIALAAAALVWLPESDLFRLAAGS